jgi:hypothetical protein
MPKFSVDIQATTEFTYQIEADTPEEAEEAAKRMYENDSTPEHEEIFDAQITNCEEIRK